MYVWLLVRVMLKFFVIKILIMSYWKQSMSRYEAIWWIILSRIHCKCLRAKMNVQSTWFRAFCRCRHGNVRIIKLIRWDMLTPPGNSIQLNKRLGETVRNPPNIPRCRAFQVSFFGFTGNPSLKLPSSLNSSNPNWKITTCFFDGKV